MTKKTVKKMTNEELFEELVVDCLDNNEPIWFSRPNELGEFRVYKVESNKVIVNSQSEDSEYPILLVSSSVDEHYNTPLTQFIAASETPSSEWASLAKGFFGWQLDELDMAYENKLFSGYEIIAKLYALKWQVEEFKAMGLEISNWDEEAIEEINNFIKHLLNFNKVTIYERKN